MNNKVYKKMYGWYLGNKERLLEMYEGQWLAITPDEDGEYDVRANDRNKKTMFSKVEEQYRSKPMLTILVGEEEPKLSFSKLNLRVIQRGLKESRHAV